MLIDNNLINDKMKTNSDLSYESEKIILARYKRNKRSVNQIFYDNYFYDYRKFKKEYNIEIYALEDLMKEFHSFNCNAIKFSNTPPVSLQFLTPIALVSVSDLFFFLLFNSSKSNYNSSIIASQRYSITITKLNRNSFYQIDLHYINRVISLSFRLYKSIVIIKSNSLSVTDNSVKTTLKRDNSSHQYCFIEKANS